MVSFNFKSVVISLPLVNLLNVVVAWNRNLSKYNTYTFLDFYDFCRSKLRCSTATFTDYGFQGLSFSHCRWQRYQLFINVSIPTLKVEQKLLTEMKFVITYILIFMKKRDYLLYGIRECYFRTWKVEPLFFNSIVLYAIILLLSVMLLRCAINCLQI